MTSALWLVSSKSSGIGWLWGRPADIFLSMPKPLDLKAVGRAHLSTFIGVAAILLSASAILLTGRYSPFWLWMQGIMLGIAVNTMMGTWQPSNFRWPSVFVIVGLVTVMCVQGFKLWQQSQ
jgi:hypothetical protein